MKKTLLLTAAAVLFAVAGAQAQPYDHGDHGPGGPGPGPGAGPHHWARGEHVPAEYWHHGHEVDWHAHHLRRPPHGYHWVQVDNQYALVGINTGIVNAVIDIR